MGMTTINAGMVKNAFLAGAKNLESKKEWINELNVFPVPDGDTGTNMTLTIMAAAKEVAKLDDPDMAQLAKAISSGSLRGARGNSGVILSQLLRGFTREIMAYEEIDTATFANALVRATDTAYKAVMKPKEGTILTVAKGMSDKALEMAAQTEDIMELIEAVIAEGDLVLSRTPEMLPVLKQAGVVDSGGEGLMQAVKGAFEGLSGRPVDFSDVLKSDGSKEKEQTGRVQEMSSAVSTSGLETEEIRFGYCTEFIIYLEKEFTENDEKELKSYLESIGDSLVVVSDDEIVKIHVHTNHPGLAFEKGLTYGSLSRMKVDNMREEHEERLLKEMESAPKKEEKERKPYGFIAVSSGEGLDEIFKGIGADYIIEGGQTMNPSTQDLLKAVEELNADNVFILPNNKNIIMAARQAAELAEGKQVYVIPSRTVPQGITALVNFLPDLTPEENLETMTEEMERVKTAQITYAVRTTCIDGTEIKEGDIMAVGDEGILAVEKSVSHAAETALSAMADDDSELITIYYGKDVTEEEAKALKERASELLADKEVELQYGGQPIYYYILSAE